MTNMIGQSGFASLFASKTLVALLKLFLTRPDESFYQRELSAAAGASLYSAQRELDRLAQSGLVTKLARGNRVYYRADRRHPAFEDLKSAFFKTVGLGDALKASLLPLSDWVKVAFVYGSYAAGRETAESDLDLLLVGALTSREAATVLGPLRRALGRELNSVVYPPAEFRRKVREGHHFLREVLAGPKLFLIGDENDLAELAGRRAASPA